MSKCLRFIYRGKTNEHITHNVSWFEDVCLINFSKLNQIYWPVDVVISALGYEGPGFDFHTEQNTLATSRSICAVFGCWLFIYISMDFKYIRMCIIRLVTILRAVPVCCVCVCVCLWSDCLGCDMPWYLLICLHNWGSFRRK